MNEEYIARVMALLERLLPLVAERTFLVRRVDPKLLVLRLDLRLLDGRRFEANEIWTASGRKYRFQMMDADGTVLWRQDNAPHHLEVTTFPHHRHTREGAVEPAEERTLEELLPHISSGLEPRRTRPP